MGIDMIGVAFDGAVAAVLMLREPEDQKSLSEPTRVNAVFGERNYFPVSGEDTWVNAHAVLESPKMDVMP